MVSPGVAFSVPALSAPAFSAMRSTAFSSSTIADGVLSSSRELAAIPGSRRERYQIATATSWWRTSPDIPLRCDTAFGHGNGHCQINLEGLIRVTGMGSRKVSEASNPTNERVTR